MNERRPTFRIVIKSSGTPPNEIYGWEIYKQWDVLPILRSQEPFVSRRAGLADANRSRLRLIAAAFKNPALGSAAV
jgi:hypothetical protein